MKISPIADKILLPLAPTIAGTIADYLQLMTQEVYIYLSQNCDNVDPDLLQNRFWHWQFEKSIRLVSTSQYQYVSAIAHRLAAKLSLTPLEICQNLQPDSSAVIVDPNFCLELCCWYNDAGYIYFQISPRSIAVWLNYIHDLPLNLQLGTIAARDDDLSPLGSVNLAIYAHARCCSLLKLADAEKLVAITANWQITTPDRSIGGNDRRYLKNPGITELTSIFEHSVEYRLIHALMEVLDGLYGDNLQIVSPEQSKLSRAEVVESTGGIVRRNSSEKIRPPNWTKLTIDLAQSWLEFYRHCRIFGDLNSQNPRLAIARCGLTAISRRYLQVLLENYLGIKASIEL